MLNALWVRNMPHHMWNTHKTHSRTGVRVRVAKSNESAHIEVSVFSHGTYTLLWNNSLKIFGFLCSLPCIRASCGPVQSSFQYFLAFFMKWICQLILLRHSAVKYYFEFLLCIFMPSKRKIRTKIHTKIYSSLLLSIFDFIFAAFFLLFSFR